MSSNSLYDLLIIGGGIHGAVFARRSAEAGMKVLLLERDSFASQTSSRSSKMAHGGLRYLEMGDLRQVLEGIRAREDLYQEAPDLVKPYPFLIPVPRGKLFFRFKLKLGLLVYDLLVRDKQRKHRWILRSDLNFPGFDRDRNDLMGCFLYYDGIMDDQALVHRAISKAKENGAKCREWSEVLSVSHLMDGAVTVKARDVQNGNEYEERARSVVNCAGPWAPFIAHPTFPREDFQARYSQGTHLIFSVPWTGPALFLPLPQRTRYYFVWPHPQGTLVGTTEREVQGPIRNPEPRSDEVEEILERVRRDLPGSGLNQQTLISSFAGIRTLPIRAGKNRTAELSRRHRWIYEDGMLSLLGGKFTTAEWTVREGMKILKEKMKLQGGP